MVAMLNRPAFGAQANWTLFLPSRGLTGCTPSTARCLYRRGSIGRLDQSRPCAGVGTSNLISQERAPSQYKPEYAASSGEFYEPMNLRAHDG